MAPNQKNKNLIIVDEYFNVTNDYYHWLCDFVDINTPKRSYFLLMQTLHKKEYYWSVETDDNRSDDGKNLRYRFVNDMKYDLEALKILNGPCSVLEMLIALAQRMDHIMDELDNKDHTNRWFWELLGNVGLDKFTDENYVDLGGETKIVEIITDVLERNYKRNGQGGFFPLKKSKEDQRKVEIWYQMQKYLIENYYFDD